jgi:hypothetical protein
MNMATPKKTTSLDVVNSVGKWISWCGLMLQILWHLSVVDMILGMRMQISAVQGWKAFLLRALPISGLAGISEDLATWTFRATLLSVWWNPLFVHFCRGFTRHILGLKQWYGFQVVLVGLRYIFPKLSMLDAPGLDHVEAHVAIHLFMLIMTVYVRFFLAPSAGRAVTDECRLHF